MYAHEVMRLRTRGVIPVLDRGGSGEFCAEGRVGRGRPGEDASGGKTVVGRIAGLEERKGDERGVVGDRKTAGVAGPWRQEMGSGKWAGGWEAPELPGWS